MCRLPRAFMASPPVHIHYFICLATHQQLQECSFDGGHAAKLILFDVPGIPEVELMCCFNNSSIDKVVLYPNNPSTPFTKAAACPQFYTT